MNSPVRAGTKVMGSLGAAKADIVGSLEGDGE